MRIAREGWPFVLVTGALVLLLAAAALLHGWGGWSVLALSAAIVLLFVLFFFRDPERAVPGGTERVVSPADGRVVEVAEIDELEVMGGACRRISIFLSIFDVHVQRAPVAGRIVHRSYRAGGYAVAWAPKASEENEQASLGIDAGGRAVLVRQIAGLVARRIVTYPEVDDRVEKGDRIGLIRFGSRVDLFVPAEWEIRCAPGDRAVGGESVLAVWTDAPARDAPGGDPAPATDPPDGATR